MADAPASAGTKSGSLGFLGRKIGPVPIWLIAVVLIGGYYWYENYGPGKSSSTAATTDAVDPVTGQTYAEELGAAQQQISDLQSQQQGGDTSGGVPTPVTGTGDGQTPPPVTTGPIPPEPGPNKPPAPKPPTGTPKPKGPLPKQPRTIGNNGAPIGHGGTVGSGAPPVRRSPVSAKSTRPVKARVSSAPAGTATRWRAA